MVKFIDGLEKLKYVRRLTGSQDRRIKLVELTDKGAKTLEVLSGIRQKVEDEFLSPYLANKKIC